MNSCDLEIDCDLAQTNHQVINQLQAEAEEKQSSEICDSTDSSGLYKYFNPVCFICKGYYGSCFEDLTCNTCHDFFYPNIASDVQIMIALNDSDGSDCDSDCSISTCKKSCSKEDCVIQLSLEQLKLETITIYNLPNEILEHVFNYLDDISLYSVSQVCTRWRDVVDKTIRIENWKNFLSIRWPLLALSKDKRNWYDIYAGLIQSCCCFKCIRQMVNQEYPIFEENPLRKHYIEIEIRNICHSDIRVVALDPLYYHWQACIPGPSRSPYMGGMFFLYIQVPCTYPMYPPVIRFLTKIFHPNISRHGDIGLNCLHQKLSDDCNIYSILKLIELLLIYPESNMCMEPDISFLYLNNRLKFYEQAELWTRRYAMHHRSS